MGCAGYVLSNNGSAATTFACSVSQALKNPGDHQSNSYKLIAATTETGYARSSIMKTSLRINREKTTQQNHG